MTETLAPWQATETRLPETPYVGLEPYREENAPFFFGRERDQRVIVANLRAARVTLLYGPSGVGKSSVLNAGVLPILRELADELQTPDGHPQHGIVVFGSWRDEPVGPLCQAIVGATETALDGGEAPAAGSLVETLERCLESYDGELLVILDQFEEYFVYHPDPRPEDPFPSQLARAITDRNLRANFLVSLREDALARLHLFKGLIPGLFENRLRLDRLTREQGADAITKPLDRYNELVRSAGVGAELGGEAAGVTIEPALVEDVLDQVTVGRVITAQAGVGSVAAASADDRIEAPYLQLVMERLWDAELKAAGVVGPLAGAPAVHESIDQFLRGSIVLRQSTLAELGGAEEIVRAHLHDALEGLTPEQRESAARMFNQLVTPSGTKIAQSAADLARYAETDVESIEPVLLDLEKARILRQDGTRYEIFHDVLAGAVLQWRTEYESERRLSRERGRRRKLVAGLAAALVLLALAVGLAIFAVVQWQSAQESKRAADEATADAQASLARAVEAQDAAEAQRDLAEAGAFSAASLSQAATDPTLSLLLATEAAGATREPTDQAANALRRALGQPSEVPFPGEPHEGDVTSISASRNGELLVTTGVDGTARIWDTETGDVRTVLKGHEGAVVSSSASADGSRLATGGDDGTVRIWDTRTGRTIRVIRELGAIVSVALSPDGGLLATATAYGEGGVWDSITGTSLVRLNGRLVAAVVRGAGGLVDPDVGRVTAVAFDPGGKWLATGTPRGLWVWKVGRWRPLHPAKREASRDTILSVAFGGDVLVAGSDLGTATIYDLGSLTKDFLGLQVSRDGAATNVAASPDGTFVLTAGAGPTVEIWDSSSGAEIAALGHTGLVTAAGFASDGVAVTGAANGVVRAWPLTVDERTSVPADPEGTTDSVNSLEFDPSGERLLISAGDGVESRARVISAGDGGSVAANGIVATAVAYSADGQRVAAANVNTGKVKLFDSELATRIAVIGRKRAPSPGDWAPYALALNPDGTRVVIVSLDGAILVWTPETDKVERFVEVEVPLTTGSSSFARAVLAAAFAPDGTWFVTGGADGTANVWSDLPSDLRGIGSAPLRHGSSAINDVAVSSTGTIATASDDRTVRLWKPDLTLQTVLLGHSGPVRTVAFSPDGRYVVTGSADATARVWETATGALLSVLPAGFPVFAAAFDPAGERIAVAGDSGDIRIFTCRLCAPPSELLELARERLGDRVLTPEERDRFAPTG